MATVREPRFAIAQRAHFRGHAVRVVRCYRFALVFVYNLRGDDGALYVGITEGQLLRGSL